MSWISNDNMTLFIYFWLICFKPPKSIWKYVFDTWCECCKMRPPPFKVATSPSSTFKPFSVPALWNAIRPEGRAVAHLAPASHSDLLVSFSFHDEVLSFALITQKTLSTTVTCTLVAGGSHPSGASSCCQLWGESHRDWGWSFLTLRLFKAKKLFCAAVNIPH